MARITIAGNAAVVISSMKYEDLKTIAKYRPERLTLYDADNKPVFAICIADEGERGGLNRYGAMFEGESHDGEGLAVMTVPLPDGEGDARERAASCMGVPLVKLNRLEESLPEALREIQAEMADAMGCITVIA